MVVVGGDDGGRGMDGVEVERAGGRRGVRGNLTLRWLDRVAHVRGSRTLPRASTQAQIHMKRERAGEWAAPKGIVPAKAQAFYQFRR